MPQLHTSCLTLGTELRFTVLFFCLFLFVAISPSIRASEIPVFQIVPKESSITFDVEASLPIKCTFDTWDASLKFTSPEVTTGVAEVRIQASSVDTGSSIKEATLKGTDFFDVDHNPLITFRSTKIIQSGPDTFEVDGDFTIRGVKRSEKLTLVVSGKETSSGTIKGILYFDRRDYGINTDIPFIKIAHRVEVKVSLIARRISGPPVVFRR